MAIEVPIYYNDDREKDEFGGLYKNYQNREPVDLYEKYNKEPVDTYEFDVQGDQYEVDVPKGGTIEEAWDKLQKTINYQAPEPAPEPQPEQDGEYKFKTEETSGLRDVADVATSALSGTVKAAGGLVGIGNYIPIVDQITEPLSAWLMEKGGDIDQALLSDRQLEMKQILSDKIVGAVEELGPDASVGDYFDYVVDTGGAVAEFIKDNPGQIFNLIAESAPQVVAGGVFAKGAKVLGASTKVAVPAGETMQMIGTSGAETSMSQEGNDQSYLENKIDLYKNLPTNIVSGVGSYFTGGLQRKLGLDVDTAILNKLEGKSLLESTTKGFGKKTLAAGIEAGEEMFQEPLQQIGQNWAQDKNLMEGVGGSAVVGGLTGFSQSAGLSSTGAVYNKAKELLGKKDTSADAVSKIAEVVTEDAAKNAEFVEDVKRAYDPNDNTFNEDGLIAKYENTELKNLDIKEVAELQNHPIIKRIREEYQQAQDAAELEAANEKLQVELKNQRATHAKTFVSQNAFEKLGKQDEDAVNTANALDPNTELGQQFLQWQMENDDFIYEDNESEVVKRFLKYVSPTIDGATRREMHLKALDEHAAWKASGQNADPEYIADLVARRKAAIEQRDVTTLNAVETEAAENLMPGEWTNAKLQALKPPAKTAKETETQTAEEISVEPETTETVVEQPKAKPVPIKKQAENLVSSLFGEDWRNDQEVVDAVGTNVDTNTGWTSDVKRGTIPKAIREINKILAARGRESEAIMNNEQVPWYAERAKAFNEVRRQEQEAAAAEAEAKAQQEEEAAAEADPLQAENDLVTSLIDNKDFSLKTKDILGLSKENQKRYKDAAKAAKKKPAPTKKKAAKKKATPKKEVVKVEPKDVAPQQVAAKTLTDYLNEGATGRNRLTSSQQKVADVLQKASLSNDLSNLITPRGTFNYTEIAKRAGLKNRSAAQQAFIQLKKKIEKKAGNETLKEFFAQKNRNQAEEVDETMQQLEGTVDTSTGVSDADANLLDVDSGMTKRKSPNDSQTDVGALNREDKAAVDKAAEEKGRIEQEQDVAEANAKIKEFLETNIYSNAEVLNQLRAFWNMGKPQGAIDFDSLPDIEKKAFAVSMAVMVQKNENGTLKGTIGLNDGNIEASEEVVNLIKEEVADTLTTLANDQKEEQLQQRIEDENKRIDSAQTTSETQETEQGAGQPKNKGKKQLNRENLKLIEQASKYAEEKLGENWFVDDKTLRDLLSNDDFKGFQERVDALAAKGVKYSLSEEDKPKIAANRQTIKELFDNLVGKDKADELFDSGRVTIFKSAAQASAVLGREIPAAAKGFVDSDGQIFFVTDNIRAGNEMGIFMHEVGVHVGINEILGDEGVEEIFSQITNWALTNEGKEGVVADRAIRNVSQLIKDKNVDEEFVKEEVVAYFIEEMVNSGVEPSTNTEGGKLLKRIWDAFQNALRNFLGETNIEVTGQDIVDMAYGAAWKALSKDVKTHANGAEKNSFRRDPILYSLNQDKNKEEVNKTIKELKKSNPSLATKMKTIGNLFKRGVDRLKFLHQLIEEYAEQMPSIVRLHQEFDAKRMTANKIKFAIEGILQRVESLSDERQQVLSKLIAKSTVEQKWAYDPRDSHPDLFDKKFNQDEEIEIDAGLEAAFNALSEEEQSIVKDLFAHGEQMLQRKQKIAADLAGKDSSKFFNAAGLRGPYAPLRRFGDWVTVLRSKELVAAEKAVQESNSQQNRDNLEKLMRDADHYVVSMFDSEAEAMQFLEDNKDSYSAEDSEYSMKEEFYGAGTNNFKVLQQVLGSIKADEVLGHSQDLSPSEKEIVKQLQSLVADLYIKSLDDSNARTTQLKRMNRAGFEQDMFKAFRSNGLADAGLIATMEHGENVHQLLAQARKEAQSDKNELMPIWNLLQYHYNRELKDHKHGVKWVGALENKIASVNTLYMLTSSLSYHLQNATQPAVVTIPRLTGDFGSQSKAWRSLFKGYRVAANIVGLPKLQSLNPAMFFKPKVTIDFDKLTGENAKYKELLETLQLKELLDVGLEQDLYEADTKNSGFKYVDKANNLLNKVSHAAYQWARLVEMYNRVSAAVAAYDLAESDPSFIKNKNITKARKALRSKSNVATTPMTSLDYAISVVQDTQGNFSEADAPAIIKGANQGTKLVMQYQKYRFMMVWAYINAAKTWWDSADVYSQEEKRAAARTFTAMTGYAFLAAGAVGMPFVGAIVWAAGGLGDLLDGEDEEKPPSSLKDYINENMDDGLAKDLLTKGMLGMIGVDGNAKLSQANLFGFSPYSDFGRTQREQKAWVTDTLLGPTSQWFNRTDRFRKYMENGDPYKAIEAIMPNGIKFPMESIRLRYEGFTNTNGDVLMANTKFSNASLIANAFGIPSSELKDLKYKRSRQYEIKEWVSERTGEIKTDYNNAWKAHKKATGKDKAKYAEKMKDARKEFFKLQEAKVKLQKLFGSSTEFKRRPISDLTRYPYERIKKSIKEKRNLSDKEPLFLK